MNRYAFACLIVVMLGTSGAFAQVPAPPAPPAGIATDTTVSFAVDGTKYYCHDRVRGPATHEIVQRSRLALDTAEQTWMSAVNRRPVCSYAVNVNVTPSVYVPPVYVYPRPCPGWHYHW